MTYSPWEPDVAVRTDPCSALCTVTVAFGTTGPAGSVIVPLKPAEPTCAASLGGQQLNRNAMEIAAKEEIQRRLTASLLKTRSKLAVIFGLSGAALTGRGHAQPVARSSLSGVLEA